MPVGTESRREEICRMIVYNWKVLSVEEYNRCHMMENDNLSRTMQSKSRVTWSGAELLQNRRKLTTRVRNNLGLSLCTVRGHSEAFQNTLNVSGGGVLSKSDE